MKNQQPILTMKELRKLNRLKRRVVLRRAAKLASQDKEYLKTLEESDRVKSQY